MAKVFITLTGTKHYSVPTGTDYAEKNGQRI